jgi:histidinol-phosphate aminotransferase
MTVATLRQSDSDPWAGFPDAEDPLALALNESPFPPLPAVRSAMLRAVDAANRYPEFLPERFRRLIAGRIGVDEQQVIVGAGATGIVMQVLQGTTRPGDRIIMSEPTFDGYPIIARMSRLESLGVPLDERGHQDLDAIADAAKDARVAVVCRPHNPTGTVAPAGDIRRFLRRISEDTLVLLDEAYIEFVPAHHRIDTVGLLERFPNVVVVRTFSKAYGLAGIRTGYGICSPRLAGALWSMQLPFGVALTSLAAVAASFNASAQLEHRVRMVTAEREYLRGRLEAMGIQTADTYANFVYLPAAGRDWHSVFDGKGPRVRTYADGGARITVGNRQSTTAVLAAIVAAPVVGAS